MQNDVLDSKHGGIVPTRMAGADGADRPASSAVDRAVDRSLAARRSVVAAEVERLVAAALVLIQRTGQVEPRVSEIIAEAGLSNQAFYKHFRSKHELLVAVLDEGVTILAGYLEHRMAQVESPRDQVREWVRGMLEQALAERGAEATRPFVLSRARLAESLPEEVARSEQQLTEPLRAALSRAVEVGELPRADPVRDSETLYHIAMGWVKARLQDAAAPEREDALRLEEFALAGLTRRPSGEAE